jgi:hypothetical protein
MKIAEQDVFSKYRKSRPNFLMMDFAWIINTVILNNSVTVASSNLSKFKGEGGGEGGRKVFEKGGY